MRSKEIKLDNGNSCLDFIKDYITKKEKGELNIFLKSAFVTIKKDLNKLHELEKENKALNNYVTLSNEAYSDSFLKLQKLEKFIDFIIYYNFDIEDFIYHTTYEQYFNYYFTNYKCLISEEVPTEEQYNLVKEVLEDE